MPYGPQVLANLNDALIDEASGQDEPLRHERGHSIGLNGAVEVVFHELENHLVNKIKQYPVVVGCMAWLTNVNVLSALASRESVSIIVNKEDFLRPDKGTWSHNEIRKLYRAIPSSDRQELGSLYSYCSDPTVQGVRCAGISAARNTIPPRMHHKFMVFCEWKYHVGDQEGTWKEISRNDYDRRHEQGQDWVYRLAVPIAVWTGSFNATFNATQSIENAVILNDRDMATAYYDEWRSLLGISEPLNWRSTYVDAEWRIGS